jgi:hypothetical protein
MYMKDPVYWIDCYEIECNVKRDAYVWMDEACAFYNKVT